MVRKYLSAAVEDWFFVWHMPGNSTEQLSITLGPGWPAGLWASRVRDKHRERPGPIRYILPHRPFSSIPTRLGFLSANAFPMTGPSSRHHGSHECDLNLKYIAFQTFEHISRRVTSIFTINVEATGRIREGGKNIAKTLQLCYGCLR